MGKLLIIRHAKSSWADPWMEDFDRVLNDRGEKDAPEMAQRLKEKGIVPDLMLSSTAARAKATAMAFAAGLGYDSDKIVWKDEIYEAEPNAIYKVVNDIAGNVNTVLIFGHNPGFTYFANDLANINIDNMPTCAVVAIEVKAEWPDVEAGSGELIWFDFPKSI